MSRKHFGMRGLPAEERARINPYTGAETPLGGFQGSFTGDGVDEKLRSFMLMVYNYMLLGLVVTGTVAFLVYNMSVTPFEDFAFVDSQGYVYEATSGGLFFTELGFVLWATPFAYVVCFGPLLFLVATNGLWRNLDPFTGMVVFMVTAVLIGVSFSGIGIWFTGESITQVFFITAIAFGGLSLVGYTTRADLTGWGSFLWMGFFGLLAAIITNIFLQPEMLTFVFSAVGVLVFSGFTMYDTQMIKEAYRQDMDESSTRSLAIQGALDLYLDFVNLFRFLLNLFGDSE